MHDQGRKDRYQHRRERQDDDTLRQEHAPLGLFIAQLDIYHLRYIVVKDFTCRLLSGSPRGVGNRYASITGR